MRSAGIHLLLCQRFWGRIDVAVFMAAVGRSSIVEGEPVIVFCLPSGVRPLVSSARRLLVRGVSSAMLENVIPGSVLCSTRIVTQYV